MISPQHKSCWISDHWFRSNCNDHRLLVLIFLKLDLRTLVTAGKVKGRMVDYQSAWYLIFDIWNLILELWNFGHCWESEGGDGWLPIGLMEQQLLVSNAWDASCRNTLSTPSKHTRNTVHCSACSWNTLSRCHQSPPSHALTTDQALHYITLHSITFCTAPHIQMYRAPLQCTMSHLHYIWYCTLDCIALHRIALNCTLLGNVLSRGHVTVPPLPSNTSNTANNDNNENTQSALQKAGLLGWLKIDLWCSGKKFDNSITHSMQDTDWYRLISINRTQSELSAKRP